MLSKSLHEHADDFIKLKKAAGLVYTAGEYWINRYLRFHDEQFSELSFPSYESVSAYLNQFTVIHQTNISYVKQFCMYLRTLGIDAYVYNVEIHQTAPRLPYIISDEEAKVLFQQIDAIQSNPQWIGKSYMLPAFFRTMWCCGVRTKEARVLRCTDVHLESCYFDILNPKNQRDRRIFLHEELTNYLVRYDNLMSTIRPGRIFFFPGESDSSPVTGGTISSNYKQCWYKAFPDFDRTVPIRPYDFRHHFVYANINSWLRDGKDVNVWVFYLMQLTGHKTIHELLYYFHLVPEIYDTINAKALDLEDLLPDIYHLEEEED